MVLASGCFDGLHAGHIRYLGLAHALCQADEPLIVAVAPDASLRAAKQREPYWPAALRAEAVAAQAGVHTVIGADLADAIATLRPRVVVVGQDWAGRLPAADQAAAESVGATVTYVDTGPGMIRTSEARPTDAAALARLEAVVQSQAPATPWTPVTPYDLESRRPIEAPHVERILQIWGDGPYLDWGCGPEAVLVRLLRERGAVAYGIDPLLAPTWRGASVWPPARGLMSPHQPVVICREVLEHVRLAEWWPLLTNWRAWHPRAVYVTTRHPPAPRHVLDVATSDDLDPTHISMLTPTLLRALLALSTGLPRRPEWEAILDWRGLGRVCVYGRADA
jgi:cytidyltransferase-like protein